MTTVIARTGAEWRAWLEQHGHIEQEVWLVLYHKGSEVPGVRYTAAVEQALCFGWIDGLHRKRDAGSSQLRFTPRRSTSNWSQSNRERAERMSEQGLMTPAGQAAIDLAKATGNWPVQQTARVCASRR